MPVAPAKRELRKSSRVLPMGVMQPRPVTTTRFTRLSDAGLGGRDRGVRFCCDELLHSFDHVAYGSDGTESFVGDLDGEGFLDLERDVDLVEGIRVELIEGALEGDGVPGNGLGFGDDLNTVLGDVFHGGAAFLLFSSTYRDASVSVKAA